MTGTDNDPVLRLAAMLRGEGTRDYFGEPLSQAAHMLQAAALAESSGAAAPLVAAALLHDVGHFTAVTTGHELMQGRDNHHAEAGADWLAQWFGPEVTGPIRLHVAAKRYLCAVEPGYLSGLSDASLYTLGVQGGPMGAEEMAAFEARPQAYDALRLRRWDDAAKDPAVSPPAFGYYQPLLRRLLRARAEPARLTGRTEQARLTGRTRAASPGRR